LWQDIAARLERLVVEICHVPKSRATVEHQNNQRVDQVAKIEVARVDFIWKHKGELFIDHRVYGMSGCQGREATHTGAHD